MINQNLQKAKRKVKLQTPNTFQQGFQQPVENSLILKGFQFFANELFNKGK